MAPQPGAEEKHPISNTYPPGLQNTWLCAPFTLVRAEVVVTGFPQAAHNNLLPPVPVGSGLSSTETSRPCFGF